MAFAAGDIIADASEAVNLELGLQVCLSLQLALGGDFKRFTPDRPTVDFAPIPKIGITRPFLHEINSVTRVICFGNNQANINSRQVAVTMAGVVL